MHYIVLLLNQLRMLHDAAERDLLEKTQLKSRNMAMPIITSILLHEQWVCSAGMFKCTIKC